MKCSKLIDWFEICRQTFLFPFEGLSLGLCCGGLKLGRGLLRWEKRLVTLERQRSRESRGFWEVDYVDSALA